MKIHIIHEDADIAVLNKPAGVVVNRAETVKSETVQDWVEEHLFRKDSSGESVSDDFRSRSGIVHRIDKETSGLLIVAKNPETFYFLQDQFKKRLVKKTYLAIVHGYLSPPEGRVSVPIGRLPWNRERFGIVPDGKPAVSVYRTLATITFRQEPASVVAVYPESGRTHQIRVHMKYLNHPLLGDYLYAGRKTSRRDREEVTRVMLHAWKIAFVHPESKQIIAFEAAIPDDMRTVLGNMNLSEEKGPVPV